MKSALLDYTNSGIIHVIDENRGPVRWQLTMLRSCIVDTNITRVNPTHPLYGELTNENVRSAFYCFDRADGIKKPGNFEVNEIFREKQRRAELMVPLLGLLIDAISKRSFNGLNEFGIPMDDTIAHEVLQSNPAAGQFSSGVLEYATTLDITPEQAYNELYLEYKTIHGVKMRTYATMKKYIALIREVKTYNEAQTLRLTIQQKLISDTYI